LFKSTVHFVQHNSTWLAVLGCTIAGRAATNYCIFVLPLRRLHWDQTSFISLSHCHALMTLHWRSYIRSIDINKLNSVAPYGVKYSRILLATLGDSAVIARKPEMGTISP